MILIWGMSVSKFNGIGDERSDTMKRRDTFRLIPITAAGMFSIVRSAKAMEHERYTKQPGDLEPLCLKYPVVIRDLLQDIRATQSEKILEASYAISRTLRKGKTVWCFWNMGHTYRSDIFPERNGMPLFITEGYDPKKSMDGDLLLLSFPMDIAMLRDLDKKDLFVIGGTDPWGGDPKNAELIKKDIQEMRFRPYSDIWIETNMTAIGPRIYIPGITSPIGPVTGPVYMTLFWMMMADTCRIMSLEGIPISIAGDEPKLSGKDVQWAGMANPLMNDLFDEIMRELELIGSELGDIRKIASMAVDTVLGGGNVYFYSRYIYSFASEAWGRRGGLSFAKGIADGTKEGTKKDCVIMGVYKPDDEVDLKNLDEFKKRGMRIASIGPITRDFKVPKGRAIFKETEAHVGRFVETYGTFAIPGFDKKVCPTSGILNCAILWVACIEIATQIIERTNGNVPSIGMSGALEMSRVHYPHTQNLVNTRGY